jgi:glycosyltransferase involved in cell wall biosynthesis
VGFLGRLTHEKGLDRLVEAVAALSRPAQLILAGPSAGVAGGGEGERLRAQAVRLGVELELPGSLPDARVAEFLRGLDVFVLPSISSLEAWGIVQVEAMLCGTPVVASALAGVREPVTRTGMGLLVRPGDVRDLARAIARVADDRATFVRSREAVIRALELDEIPLRHVRALAALTRDAPRRGDRSDRWG